LSLEDARRPVEAYVERYNNVRLNSAIGYITPKDMLAGRRQEIHAERDSEAGEGPKTASDSAAAGCVKKEPFSPFPVGANTSKYYAVRETLSLDRSHLIIRFSVHLTRKSQVPVCA
jgi:hypothetical protein